MSSGVLQLIVLAGIAIFLILKLRSVLGTREGFEKPPAAPPGAEPRDNTVRDFEVIEGGPDRDITDHAEEGSDTAEALAAMKKAELGFSVSEFLGGARGAYEMILMAFENGELDDIRDFLAPEVFDTFVDVVGAREDQGLTVEANFIGVRDTALVGATFDEATGDGEVLVKFVGELTSVVRDSDGNIVEGDPTEIKRQKDVWTFGRKMGADDPNWQLVATGE